MKWSVVFFFCSIFSIKVIAQEVDFKNLLRENWLEAEEIVSSLDPDLQKKSESIGIPYRHVISIVFPELVRYSALRDKIEISLLKTLYVYKGEEYADFSVGIFQMKPSFAVKVRQEIQLMNDTVSFQLFNNHNCNPDDIEFRTSIISDLENPNKEFIYLLGFYRICEEKFKNKIWTDNNEKIKFYASAFNCGFNNPVEYIENMMGKKFLSLNTLHTNPKYSYSEIAAFYFNNN